MSKFIHYTFTVSFASKLKDLPGFSVAPIKPNERYVGVKVRLSDLPQNHDTFICPLLSKIEGLERRKRVIPEESYNRLFDDLGKNFQSYLKLADTIETKEKQTSNKNLIKAIIEMLVHAVTSVCLYKYVIIPFLILPVGLLPFSTLLLFSLMVFLAALPIISVVLLAMKFKEIIPKFSSGAVTLLSQEKQALEETKTHLNNITQELAKILPVSNYEKIVAGSPAPTALPSPSLTPDPATGNQRMFSRRTPAPRPESFESPESFGSSGSSVSFSRN
jgi:hypothetical protein